MSVSGRFKAYLVNWSHLDLEWVHLSDVCEQLTLLLSLPRATQTMDYKAQTNSSHLNPTTMCCL